MPSEVRSASREAAPAPHAGAAAAPFRLGATLVVPERQVLVVDGRERRVPRGLMACLVELARADGRVVTRQQLLDAAWDERYVSDESLTQAIYRLRRALGDSADRQVVIETVPKRGYRLLMPVMPVETSSDVSPSRRGPTLVARWRPLTWLPWVIAVLTTVLWLGELNRVQEPTGEAAAVTEWIESDSAGAVRFGSAPGDESASEGPPHEPVGELPFGPGLAGTPR